MRIVPKRIRFSATLLASLLLSLSVTAQAHEFWIEPRDFTPNVGAQLQADIKVGQRLTGRPLKFIPNLFESFEVIRGNERAAITSEDRAVPAVDEKNTEDGLVILAYSSTPRSLRYGIGMKFGRFLQKEGMPWVMERHQQRGLPEKGFVEAYSRFAKSLVKSGSGKGKDRTIGLELELVLLTNPYLATETNLSVKVLWEGEPLAGAQLSAFFKPDSASTEGMVLIRYQTDQDGVVTLPRPGRPGTMLLNAVHMIEPNKATMLKTGAVWESLWASTTFAIE